MRASAWFGATPRPFSCIKPRRYWAILFLVVAPALISSADISHCPSFNDTLKGFFLCRNERWLGLNPVDKIDLTLWISHSFSDLNNSFRISAEQEGIYVIERRSSGHRGSSFSQFFKHAEWNLWPHISVAKTCCLWIIRAKALAALEVCEDSSVISSRQNTQILLLIFSMLLIFSLLLIFSITKVRKASVVISSQQIAQIL